VPGVEDLSMTTNGVLLAKLATSLARAGLSRVNVHVDTLDPERLKRVMRFGTVEEIMEGIAAAESAGFRPIKLNAVVVRDYNDADVVDLAALTLERDWHVRFIELMPLGGGECARLALSQFVPSAESRRRIEERFGPLHPLPRLHESDESCNHCLPAARGVVGFISPVSDPYCGTCNRMRLTADGKLHLCLLNDDEVDLRPVLRNGGGVAKIADMLLKSVAAKPTGHRLDEGLSTRKREMFQIGG
jgi:cyclic pyranopterin phosphate synthase